MGWTPEYAKTREANLAEAGRGSARILPQMKRYTEFGTEVLRRLDEGGVVGAAGIASEASGVEWVEWGDVSASKAGGGGEGEGAEAMDLDLTKKEVRRVLYSFEDANCLPLALKGIEKLGIPKLVEGLIDW